MFVEVNGIRLHYDESGQGLPLILIHGFPLSAAMWERQRQALAANYRVITPDLRGFGQSEPGTAPASIALYADDLRALLDQLGIQQAVLAGLSMGGYIALAFAGRYPERLAGLVLANTKAGADNDEGKEKRNRMIELARERGSAAIADQMLPKMFASMTGHDQPDLIIRARELMASQPVEGVAAALSAMRDRPDSTALLPSIGVPTLVISGAEDALIPLADSELILKDLPGARLEVIAQAGHLSNLEQPYAFNQAITDFIEASGIAIGKEA